MPLLRLSMDASKTGRKWKLGSARVPTSTPEKQRLPELSAEKNTEAKEPKGKPKNCKEEASRGEHPL